MQSETRSEVKAEGAQAEGRGLLYVGIAVLFFSTSPVFAAWADPLSAYEKTFGRMALAAVVVGLLRAWRGEKLPPRSALPRFVGYGLVAALHFLLYIASLLYTSPAHSLAIVYTAPIFVTIFSTFFLHEPIKRRQWGGIVVAIAGVVILVGFEPNESSQMLFGDLLALGSAVCFGLYSVMGRYERDRYSLFSYASTVYGLAACWLAVGAIYGGVSRLSLPPLPGGYFPAGALLAVVGLGLLPLALGHTLYNAGLRLIHATYINVVATQEVTGGILLTWWLLGREPSGNSLLGAFVTLIGVVAVVL